MTSPILHMTSPYSNIIPHIPPIAPKHSIPVYLTSTIIILTPSPPSSVSGNSLGDGTAHELAVTLADSTSSLVHVDLSHNKLSWSGVHVLVQSRLDGATCDSSSVVRTVETH